MKTSRAVPVTSHGLPRWWDPGNKQAMLICRISDKNQLDGVSLQSQLHRQQEYAASVGLEVAYVDQFQESAKDSGLRAHFHRALATARKMKIRHLVFLSSDRLARNFTDAEIIEKEVRKGTYTVHFAADRRVLDARSGDTDFFMQDIAIAQSKQENRVRSSKTIDGMEQRSRNGWYPSRPPAFYFQKALVDDAGRVRKRGSTVEEPSEEGRRLVRREMELRLDGASFGFIRETCIREGLVPAKMRGSYYASTVEKHLKQDFYAALEKPHGDFKSQFVWRGTWYEAKHEPIFSYDEWLRLQESFGLRRAYRKVKHQGLFNQGPLRLTCGLQGCGCLVTFAPVTKPKTGTTFRYYHCADGRRVHRERGLRQVNVREENILAQLGDALDSISVGDGLATAIADALNASHRAARAERERAVASFEAELAELDAKENRLFDRLDAGTIDGPTFKSQQERLRAERAVHLEKMKTAQGAADDEYLVTADRVLELAKSAKNLWSQRSERERVDLLSRVVSNPRLEGKNVLFSLKKPFAALAKMRESGEWRPQRDLNPR